MKKYLWICLTFFALVGCEDLEDTYDAGDGLIRYVGQCTNVSVSPGWNRLIVKWTNSVDPTIKNIKIFWSLDGVTRDTLLAREATECSIPNLENGNYGIQVCAVDIRDSLSYSSLLFSRPYTPEHEKVRSFSRLVSKYYMVKDRLVLFFSRWDDNITEASLVYTSKESDELKSLPLTAEFIQEHPYYLLPEAVDFDKDIAVVREGRIEGCDDLIKFEPYVLGRDKLYTAEMKNWAKQHYNREDVTEDWVERMTELEFDYSWSSFEDILNFPNLQKLSLGKIRYMSSDFLDDSGWAQVYNKELSLFVLDVAHELLGLTVERYGQHYFMEERPYVQQKEIPVLPKLEYYDASTWEYTCSEDDEGIFESYLEHLFDGNFTTIWQPELRTYARSYEIIVDMKGVQALRGLTVVQQSFLENNLQGRSLMPNMIGIQYSENNISWTDATSVVDNFLGVSNGEGTVIYFKELVNARYLKFKVADQMYGSNYSVALAEIGIFK